jgi:hypothetical protein
MDEMLERFLNNLVSRLSGPLTFRFLIQPGVATILAIRDGLKDARQGRPPYFWAIFTRRDERRRLLREGWKAVAKVFTIAVLLDVVYQIMVIQRVYPGEALVVAFALAFLPYLLMRGPIGRIARLWSSREGKVDPQGGAPASKA